MSIHKLLSILFLMMVSPISVFAEEDPSWWFQQKEEISLPSLHGLYLGMPKEDAAKVMESWYNDGVKVKQSSVNSDKYSLEHHNKGYYYDIFILDETGTVSAFKISGETTNKLFNVADMDLTTFAQAIVDNYIWIDELNHKSEFKAVPVFDFGNSMWTEQYKTVEWFEFSNHSQGWGIHIDERKEITVLKIQKVSKEKNFN